MLFIITKCPLIKLQENGGFHSQQFGILKPYTV